MKNSNFINSVLIFLVTMTLSVASFLLGYQWHMEDHRCEPVEIETMCYSLDSGTDGIIRLRVDEDSLNYVVFIQQSDTFALDALDSTSLDSLVNVLYPAIQ